MESQIVKDLISFYQALNHSEVIKLIEQDVDLSKFKILEDKYYKVYVPHELKKPVPMLCVHSDSVFSHIPRSFSMKKGKLSCKNKGTGLSADDRNGCLVIHQIMLQKPTDFIFAVFDLEELGCLGSRSFNMFSIHENVSIIIGLDRANSHDFALYNFENEELLNILETFPNYHLDFGSISDCSVLAEASNICCFNLSVGYYKQHTEKEFTIVRDVERAEKFLLNLPGEFWGKQFLVDYIFDDQMWEYDNYHDTFSDFLKPSLFKKGGRHAK